ncbi:hypothetical protein HK105_202013 [Polyrhizophydium stewartii]|uniref:Uncharacterized protein n=1 Tax=Polyrhizophydium stewartii TaxID=2732419 RepID=A0ABR4NGI4_9FUNG
MVDSGKHLAAAAPALLPHPTPARAVRIVVVGDPGVGKTSLVHLVCNGEPLQPASGWSTGTRGCTLHVKQHTPRTVRFGRSTSSLIDAAPPPPSPSPAPAVWVEFVDVGGRCNHPASRRPLYAKADGVLLVYDTGSAMSLAHLRGWRDEVLRAAAATGRGGRESAPSAPGGDDAFEVLVGGAAAARDAFGLDATPEMPMLVVGTKSDLVQASLMASMAFMSASRSGPILGADEPKPAIAAAAMPWLSLFSGQRQPLWGFAPSQKSVIEEFDLQSIRLSTQFVSETTSSVIEAFIDQVIDHATRCASRQRNAAAAEPTWMQSAPSLAASHSAPDQFAHGRASGYGSDAHLAAHASSGYAASRGSTSSLAQAGAAPNSSALSGGSVFAARTSSTSSSAGSLSEGRRRFGSGTLADTRQPRR